MEKEINLDSDELSQEELKQVNGAWIANIIGAFAGAVGGASSKSLWSAGLVGAGTGFFNPVGSVGRLAGSVGLGLGGGAIGNAVDSQ